MWSWRVETRQIKRIKTRQRVVKAEKWPRFSKPQCPLHKMRIVILSQVCWEDSVTCTSWSHLHHPNLRAISVRCRPGSLVQSLRHRKESRNPAKVVWASASWEIPCPGLEMISECGWAWACRWRQVGHLVRKTRCGISCQILRPGHFFTGYSPPLEAKRRIRICLVTNEEKRCLLDSWACVGVRIGADTR